MPVLSFALSAAASARVASLNLCSDEYLLLLARPGEVASVTYLARDPAESSLWKAARQAGVNRGSIADVITQRPTLVLTMGMQGRISGEIAKRLHLKVIDLPQPADIDDVIANLQTVASALGDPKRARAYVDKINYLRATMPKHAVDSVLVGSGGSSQAHDALGARWMRLAGLRQRGLPGNRLSYEELVTNPPKVLLKSQYRSNQYSLGSGWWDNPLVARTAASTFEVDGRAWTCGGPLMIGEIERLRARPK